MKIEIDVINPITSTISKADAELIQPCIEWEAQWVDLLCKECGKAYKMKDGKGPKKLCPDCNGFGLKQFHKYTKNAFTNTARNSVRTFPTGLIHRILEYAQFKGIEVDVYEDESFECPWQEPHLIGITPRPDQIKQIQEALMEGRGVLTAPTGTGKTILSAMLFSAYMDKDFKGLFLAHTIDLVRQAAKEFKKFGFKVTTVGEGEVDFKGTIVVSTIQTFINHVKNYSDVFYCIIVDEVHHVVSATYQKIFNTVLTPHRYGFSASPKKDIESQILTESAIGPMISELSWKEAQELELLAKPKLKLLNCPDIIGIEGLNPKGQYRMGIVNNVDRNTLIAKTARDMANENKSMIVFVSYNDQGIAIQDILRAMGIDAPFAHGGIKGKEREQIIDDMENKRILITVANIVFKEGINIRTLDSVFLAGGFGMGDTQIIQSIGRNLRKHPDKEQAYIFDIIDRFGSNLIRHSMHRVHHYINLDLI